MRNPLYAYVRSDPWDTIRWSELDGQYWLRFPYRGWQYADRLRITKGWDMEAVVDRWIFRGRWGMCADSQLPYALLASWRGKTYQVVHVEREYGPLATATIVFQREV